MLQIIGKDPRVHALKPQQEGLRSDTIPSAAETAMKFLNEVNTAEKGIARSAGRPRSEIAHAAILEAGYRLLGKNSLQSISTQQIASEAGVSTATLYRWWPTKEAVLLDAYLSHGNDEALSRTDGSPLERLRAHAANLGQVLEGEHGRIMMRLLMAIQEDEALRKEFLDRLYRPKTELCMAVLKEAMAQGELPTDMNTRLFLDCVFGILLTRVLIRHERVDAAFVEEAFEFAIAGALNAGKSKVRRRALR